MAIRWSFLLLLLTHQLSEAHQTQALSSEVAGSAITERELRVKRWTQFKPFIPSSRDYSLETGIMWEKNSLYWLGGQIGWHVGRCMLSNSQTCQQYFDILGGVGGRDGLTNGMVAGSLRWQFIKVPNYFSPSVRVFTGMMNINDDQRDKRTLLWGAGYGISMAIDERVDMKWEMRAGYADRVWAQTFLSFGFRVDQWLIYFSKKIKKVGVGTVKATGKVLKKTIQAPGQVYDYISGDEEKKNDSIKKK